MIPKVHFVLSYFHGIKGPDVFLSAPEILPQKLEKTIRNIFDINAENPFFEYVVADENVKITNFNFEIPSDWARGKSEMCMLSIITPKEFKNEQMQDLLSEAVTRIKSSGDIYKSLYKEDKPKDQDEDVNVKYDELRSICFNWFKEFEDKVKETQIRELIASKRLSIGGAFKVFGTIVADMITQLLQEKTILLCGDLDTSAALLTIFKRIFLDLFPVDNIVKIVDKSPEENPEVLVINTGLGIVESGEVSQDAHGALLRYLQEADKTGNDDAAIILIRQKIGILLKVADLLEKTLKDKTPEKKVLSLIRSKLKLKLRNDELHAVKIILRARDKENIAENIAVSKLSSF